MRTLDHSERQGQNDRCTLRGNGNTWSYRLDGIVVGYYWFNGVVVVWIEILIAWWVMIIRNWAIAKIQAEPSAFNAHKPRHSRSSCYQS